VGRGKGVRPKREAGRKWEKLDGKSSINEASRTPEGRKKVKKEIKKKGTAKTNCGERRGQRWRRRLV